MRKDPVNTSAEASSSTRWQKIQGVLVKTEWRDGRLHATVWIDQYQKLDAISLPVGMDCELWTPVVTPDEESV